MLVIETLDILNASIKLYIVTLILYITDLGLANRDYMKKVNNFVGI